MSKLIYRYFCRKARPSEIPPFEGIVSASEYEKPLDSGNGKKMYGYIDYDRELFAEEAEPFGLEAAPVNPIKA